MHLTGNISSISRGSLHDGDGVRTVVYFKGCTLRCAWCHNPENLSTRPDVMYAPNKCIACGNCINICPRNHKAGTDKMLFVREGCIGCGKCVEVCPTRALSLCGKKMSTDEVFSEIKKDMHYYSESGGGVTLSGGECLMQPDFAAELLKHCKENNIHTAIESAFCVPFENVKKVLGFVDLVFADLKHHDGEEHKKYTGRGNELIIENIKRVSEIHDNVIIRIPLIPGVNDSEADIREFSKIINTFGDGVKGVELLKYNYLAESKYEGLGMEYKSFGTEKQTEEQMKLLSAVLGESIRQKVYYVE